MSYINDYVNSLNKNKKDELFKDIQQSLNNKEMLKHAFNKEFIKNINEKVDGGFDGFLDVFIKAINNAQTMTDENLNFMLWIAFICCLGSVGEKIDKERNNGKENYLW